MAKYAFDHQFTETRGWQWAKKYKRYAKRFIRVMACVNNSQKTAGQGRKKIKFGIQVLTNVCHSEQLDKEAGNTMWADAIPKDLAEINKSNLMVLNLLMVTRELPVICL